MRPLMFRARVVLADGSSHMAYPDVGETQGKFLWLYEEYEVMQYIGLMDKQGKKIYEKDIIRGVFGQGVAEFEVRWDLNGYRLRCVRDFYGGPEENKVVWISAGQWIDMPTHMDLSEVIGNIYDNSDLLQEVVE